jgi:hypothetical protein
MNKVVKIGTKQGTFVSLNFEFLLFWIIMMWLGMVQKGESSKEQKRRRR